MPPSLPHPLSLNPDPRGSGPHKPCVCARTQRDSHGLDKSLTFATTPRLRATELHARKQADDQPSLPVKAAESYNAEAAANAHLTKGPVQTWSRQVLGILAARID